MNYEDYIWQILLKIAPIAPKSILTHTYNVKIVHTIAIFVLWREHITNSVVRDTSGKLEYDNSSSLKIRSCEMSNIIVIDVLTSKLCLLDGYLSICTNVFKRKLAALNSNIILLTDLQPGCMRDQKLTKMPPKLYVLL